VSFSDFFEQDVQHQAVDKDRAVFQLTGKMFAKRLFVDAHVFRDALMRPSSSNSDHHKVLIILVFLERRTAAPISDRLNLVTEHVDNCVVI